MGNSTSNNNHKNDKKHDKKHDKSSQGYPPFAKETEIDSPALTIDWENSDLASSEAESIDWEATVNDNLFINQKNISNTQQNKQSVETASSPFISTEMYKKIMNTNNVEASSDSPFVSKDAYEKIMKGGHKFSSTSSSEPSSKFIDSIKSITISSTTEGNKNISTSTNKKSSSSFSANLDSSSTQNVAKNASSSSEYNVKMYGFSQTSSEIIKTSDNNYVNNNTSSQTPYHIDSSSINTSDIKLVSVDGVNSS